MPGPDILRKKLTQKLDSTEIGELLREFGLVTDQ
jgi:oleate hydratase